MFKRSLFAVAFAAATSSSAYADEINYSYIELGVDRGDYGDGDLIQDGINLSGSVAITDNFYISGIYRNAYLQSEDTFMGLEFRGQTEFDYWNLNFGYHQSLDTNNDLIVEIGYENNKLDTEFFVDDVLNSRYESSYNDVHAAIGLRTTINKHWETLAKLGIKGNNAGYIDVRPTVGFGVIYKINTTWAVNFDTKMDSFGISRYGLGLRAYFGAEKTDSTTVPSSTNTEFSYTYIQAGLTGFEHFYDGEWTGGYDVRGSYGFANNFYVHARFAQFNTGQFELHDQQQYEIGFGYHAEMTPNNDFLVDISRGTVDSGCSIFECLKESGYNLSAGLRTAITEHLQAKAMLGYNFGGDRYMYDRKTTANIDVTYNINDKLDVFFDTKLLNLYESFYTFGARIKF
jgi:hypothetical protein